MTTAEIATKVTPEDLLKLDGDYELVGGVLKERNVSNESSRIAFEIGSEILQFAKPRGLGRVYGSDLLVRVFPDPMETRRPDAAFIAADRLPAESGFCRVAPDLVVEVLSPNDDYGDLRAKVDAWLSAGVRVAWLVLPRSREIQVFLAEGHPLFLTADDLITGDDVLPGFSVRVGDLFLSDVANPAKEAE